MLTLNLQSRQFFLTDSLNVQKCTLTYVADMIQIFSQFKTDIFIYDCVQHNNCKSCVKHNKQN